MLRREVNFDGWFKFVDVQLIVYFKITDAFKYPTFQPFDCAQGRLFNLKPFNPPMPNEPPAENFEIWQRLFERCRRGMDGKNPTAVFYKGVQPFKRRGGDRLMMKMQNERGK